MASPLFSGQVGQLMQIANAVNQARQNPSMIGQILKDHGKINSKQLREINKLGGDPSQIGQYLINNNILGQNEAMQLYQNGLPQVQNAITQK